MPICTIVSISVMRETDKYLVSGGTERRGVYRPAPCRFCSTSFATVFFTSPSVSWPASLQLTAERLLMGSRFTPLPHGVTSLAKCHGRADKTPHSDTSSENEAIRRPDREGTVLHERRSSHIGLSENCMCLPPRCSVVTRQCQEHLAE